MGKYNIIDRAKYTYFQMPKILFFGKKYKSKLTAVDRDAYAVLLDRLNVSIKNNWVDENGDIYFVYSNKELMKTLNVSKPTLMKIKTRLRETNLLVEERTGRANRLYLLEPIVSNSEEAKYILETEKPDKIDRTKLSSEDISKISKGMKEAKNSKPKLNNLTSALNYQADVKKLNFRSKATEHQRLSLLPLSKNNLVRNNKVRIDDDDINIRSKKFVNQSIINRLEQAGIEPVTEAKLQPFEEVMYQLVEEHHKDYKEAEEVILLAIEVYELNNGKSINYFISLFKDWEEQKLYTAADIQEYIDNYRNPFSKVEASDNAGPVPMINWLKELKGE